MFSICIQNPKALYMKKIITNAIIFIDT